MIDFVLLLFYLLGFTATVRNRISRQTLVDYLFPSHKFQIPKVPNFRGGGGQLIQIYKFGNLIQKRTGFKRKYVHIEVL